MGFLGALFGRKNKQAQPYLDAGTALLHKLVTNFALPGWTNDLLPIYSPEELQAIDRSLSEFQKTANKELGRETKFHPEIVPKLQRMLAAQGLHEFAGMMRTFSDELPANWKSHASTYLKAWACHLNPMVLLDLGELLVKAGYRTEAKETFQVVLLFPTYAHVYYGGQQDFGFIIRAAKEALEDLG